MTDVSPVTESEMQEWFRRLSTMIVASSNQSQEIKRLQEDFAVSNQRLSDLASDNGKLKAEVADTWKLMQEIEKDRDAAKLDLHNANVEIDRQKDQHQRTVQDYDGRLQQAHDAMAARDQRIAALEAQVKEVQSRSDSFEKDAVSAHRTAESLQGNVRYWTGRAEQAERERDNCHSTLAEQSRTISNLSDKLTAVQAKLQEFRSLFENPAPAKDEVQF